MAGTRSATARLRRTSRMRGTSPRRWPTFSSSAFRRAARWSPSSNPTHIATATLAVYAGAHRSIKPAAQENTEAMTKQDAMRFPVIGSCVLFDSSACSAPPKDLVVSAPFTSSCSGLALSPSSRPLARFVPKSFAGKVMKFETLPTIPLITDGPSSWSARRRSSSPASLRAASAGGTWWRNTGWQTTPWARVFPHRRRVSHADSGRWHHPARGTLLLRHSWVFFTPVMVTVAKSFDAPIKLLFPRVVEPGSKSPFSMLGLGDIVVRVLRGAHAANGPAAQRGRRRRVSRRPSGTPGGDLRVLCRIATTLVITCSTRRSRSLHRAGHPRRHLPPCPHRRWSEGVEGDLGFRRGWGGGGG